MIKGVDISSWQGDINFEKMKNAGIEFAFIRKQFGMKEDSMFFKNLELAQEQGILAGAYFFPIKKFPISVQLEIFLSSMENVFTDIPPVIDVETYDSNILSGDDIIQIISGIKERLKTTSIIYTSTSMWKTTGEEGNLFFSKYPLWLAQWNSPLEDLVIPHPWSDWTFWQTNVMNDGSKYGTSPYNAIDLNYYNGNKEMLVHLNERL